MDSEITTFDGQMDITSQRFLGQWHRLISTTNWDKGRVILDWRQAMLDLNTPAREYSDEAWSQQVENVSPQHVGRLRRVYERFSGVRDNYEGLYWSHFQAALDWDDAEMWLEGAVQSQWSVSRMRRQRWETLGRVASEEPRAEDVVEAELDEDFSESDEAAGPHSVDQNVSTVQDPGSDLPTDEDNSAEDGSTSDSSDDGDYGRDASASDEASSMESAAVRPFEDLPDLPDDLADALETFKLVILRHKMSGWEEVSQLDMISCLRSLEQLAVAPAEA
jgi:hypothetical protein